jgi:hypothetical protein
MNVIPLSLFYNEPTMTALIYVFYSPRQTQNAATRDEHDITKRQMQKVHIITRQLATNATDITDFVSLHYNQRKSTHQTTQSGQWF